MSFDTALNALIVNEKWGLADVEGDPGGRTFCGITERYYPEVLERILAAGTDIERRLIVEEYYEREFWEPLYCHEMPYILAFHVFDAAVLAGKGSATLALQRACMLGGADLLLDAKFGPRTLNAVKKLCRDGHTRNLIGSFRFYFGSSLHLIARTDEEKRQFLWGWMRRLSVPGEESVTPPSK
jgi:lysozyme family protein